MGPSKDQKLKLAFSIAGTFGCLAAALISLLLPETPALAVLIAAALFTGINLFVLSTISPNDNLGGKVVLGIIGLPVCWATLGFFMSFLFFGIYAVASLVFYGVVILVSSANSR